MSEDLEKPITEEKVVLQDPLKEIKSKLTDTDKENFFKAFVADQSYTEIIHTFGDKLRIEFSTLSVEENDAILQQQRYDVIAGIAQKDDQYLIRVIKYRIAASLKSINEEPFAKDITLVSNPNDPKTNSTYLLKRIDLMAKWPTFKFGNITDAFNRFEQKVMALTEESFKESF